MRYLELLVTDLADSSEPAMRTEWIHRDHIETIEPYTTGDHGQQVLWLELTLTSGRFRYVPVRPVHPENVDAVARAAIAALLEPGKAPVRAALLGEEPAAPHQQETTHRAGRRSTRIP